MKSNRNIKYGSGSEHEMEERPKGSGSEIDLRREFIGKAEGQGRESIIDSGFESGDSNRLGISNSDIRTLLEKP